MKLLWNCDFNPPRDKFLAVKRIHLIANWRWGESLLRALTPGSANGLVQHELEHCCWSLYAYPQVIPFRYFRLSRLSEARHIPTQPSFAQTVYLTSVGGVLSNIEVTNTYLYFCRTSLGAKVCSRFHALNLRGHCPPQKMDLWYGLEMYLRTGRRKAFCKVVLM